ncbi:MAG: HypC/HybG/HupF family hydrogenase formation chaperone [Chloroflexota bacterium]
MCLGFPMTVLSGDDTVALCERKDETAAVSMLLVGPQPRGTRVLVYLGTAMRVLDAEEARTIDDALDGLAAALRGENFEQFFGDLVDREPQLPDFLRSQK